MPTVKDALKDVKEKIKDTKDEIRSIPEIIMPEPVAPVRKFLQRRFPILRRQQKE